MKTDKQATKISENYSIRKDRYQWILTEHYLGKDKDDNPKELTRDSYHSTLEQVAAYLVKNKEQHSLDGYIDYAINISSDIHRTLYKALEEEK